MNRFNLLKKIITSFALLFCVTSFLSAQSFVTPLPIPYLMKGPAYKLTIDSGSHVFGTTHGDSVFTQPIRTLCYNDSGKATNRMTYLGPTMVWQRGSDVEIELTNNLSGPTTTHWHGLNLPANMDGGPHEWFGAGTQWKPKFPIIDPVQTVWYHSHLMDSTTEQVIMGMAGMILIEDPNDPYKDSLPHDYPTASAPDGNDYPIILQEKGFNFSVSKDTAISQIATDQPGDGPFTLVNGVMTPVLTVPRQIVRLRVLNGSQRKSFHFGISPQLNKPSSASMLPMWQFATDGGYMAMPYETDSALISPGERMEFLVDFTQATQGSTVYLSNLVRSVPLDILTGSGAGFGTQTRDTLGAAFMAFVVDSNIKPANPIMVKPTNLLPYSVTLADTNKSRIKSLWRIKNTNTNNGGFPNLWVINDGADSARMNDTMNMGLINDTVMVDTKEMWTIMNKTQISHPFHIHKVQFQVYQYTGAVGTEDTTNNHSTYTWPNLPAYMLGYKDDILIRAGATVKFVAVFNQYGDTMIDSMNSFMYHCHILTHEDHAMMHQFVVIDSMALMKLSVKEKNIEMGSFFVYPNPAGNVINISGESNKPGTLRFIDLLGRTLYQEKIQPFNGTVPVNIEGIPRGMVVLEWTSGSQHYTQKVLLK